MQYEQYICPKCGGCSTISKGNMTITEWIIVTLCFLSCVFSLVPGLVLFIHWIKLERCAFCGFVGRPVSENTWEEVQRRKMGSI